MRGIEPSSPSEAWKKSMMGPFTVRWVPVILAITLFFDVGLANGQKKFAGVELVPAPLLFLVLKNANVRAKPKAKSKRVGRLKKGRRIKVAGRAKGTRWFVVTEGGKPIGFIYGTIVTPLLDGRLEAPLSGSLSAKGKPSCRYKIVFEGKTKTEGEIQETADYGVSYSCEAKTKSLEFTASMFITELPFQLTRNEVYQISVDLLELPGVDDGELSVISMYDLAKGMVRFDGISTRPDQEVSAKSTPKITAKSLYQALRGAVQLAFEAWPPSVFIAIRERSSP